MLDELGVVDPDGDGKRELPDGSKLRITLDYPADAVPSTIGRTTSSSSDWEAIGIDDRHQPRSAGGVRRPVGAAVS